MLVTVATRTCTSLSLSIPTSVETYGSCTPINPIACTACNRVSGFFSPSAAVMYPQASSFTEIGGTGSVLGAGVCANALEIRISPIRLLMRMLYTLSRQRHRQQQGPL